MKSLLWIPLVIVMMLAVCPVFCETIIASQTARKLEMVTVSDPGNAADTRYETPGYGAVEYIYQIGKYEVTANQYTEFLNAVAITDTYGLYNPKMRDQFCRIKRVGKQGDYTYSVTRDWANRPVNHVSFWDACRFANWLHNGKPKGNQNASTTEDGAYLLNGCNDRDGRTVVRKAGAKWFVPNENEWYKSAYYKGGGTNAGYWDYAIRSNEIPSVTIVTPDPGNNANIVAANGARIGPPDWLTNVGEFENSKSAYGTFDQVGNVNEWNESLLSAVDGGLRCIRGGAFNTVNASELMASYRNPRWLPNDESFITGFRVAYREPIKSKR